MLVPHTHTPNCVQPQVVSFGMTTGVHTRSTGASESGFSWALRLGNLPNHSDPRSQSEPISKDKMNGLPEK